MGKLGYSIHKEGGGKNYGGEEMFISDKDNVLTEQMPKEVFREIRTILRNTESWAKPILSVDPLFDVEEVMEDVLDEWAEIGPERTKKGMNNLEVVGEDEIRMFHDRENVCYITFKEDIGVVVITKKDIKIQTYDSLKMGKDKIWKNQMLELCVATHEGLIDKRDRIKGNRTGTFPLKIIPENKWTKLEDEADKGDHKKWKSGDWLKYVRCLTSYPVRDENEQVLKWKFDPERYNLLKKNIGYLVHTHKDPLVPKSVIFYDSSGASTGEAEGGSGKSLMLKTTGFIRNLKLMGGKQLDQSQQFVFEGIELDHQVVLMDDLEKTFKFDKLFDVLTTALVIKRKYKAEQTIPFENCPKFALCSNHALEGGQQNSYMRRQSILEISSFFSEKNNKREKYNEQDLVFNNGKGNDSSDGRRFFGNGWDEEEWNLFYNWMFRSIQSWLKTSHLETTDQLEARGIVYKDSKMKALKDSGVDIETQEWIEKLVKNILPKIGGNGISKEDLFKRYQDDLGLESISPKQTEIDTKKFKEDIFNYCKSNNILLKKTGKGKRLMVKNKKKVLVEHIAVL